MQNYSGTAYEICYNNNRRNEFIDVILTYAPELYGDKAMKKIPSSEITPEHVYLSRRSFMKGAGALAGIAALTACGANVDPGDPGEVSTSTDEFGDELTTYEAIASYVNYYEFSTDKNQAATLAEEKLQTDPWTVTVGGMVNNPQTYDAADLRRKFPAEERIYRLRCVEAWSMVIPWFGFPLSALLEEVEPQPDAKYVRFETLYDPDQMPGQKSPWYQWPYVEGLRIDEAMHDLTILATGIYGKDLLPQNGAPVRLVVPWKYGFKSIKSIVKIDLVDKMPVSLWMAAAPNEYGFFANVNPNVDHPRWSQASERRIGETGRRDTLMFNGYAEEVAHLYEGMDLQQNF
jgi:sulfoxide reductase catalytic subunit YedY